MRRIEGFPEVGAFRLARSVMLFEFPEAPAGVSDQESPEGVDRRFGKASYLTIRK